MFCTCCYGNVVIPSSLMFCSLLHLSMLQKRELETQVHGSSAQHAVPSKDKLVTEEKPAMEKTCWFFVRRFVDTKNQVNM